MAKKQSLFVDHNQKPISGYHFGSYWFGCNGRTISGLCGDSFNSEGELLASYDNVFGQGGSAGGIVRVYEDGTTVRLRDCPSTNRNRTAIRSNVTAKIRELKADMLVGMSITNLRQITPTNGVTCAVPMYRSLFKQVAMDVAKKLKFDLYD